MPVVEPCDGDHRAAVTPLQRCRFRAVRLRQPQPGQRQPSGPPGGTRVRGSLRRRHPCPEHTFRTPVPVVVRIVWEHDGEERIETEALGWSNADA